MRGGDARPASFGVPGRATAATAPGGVAAAEPEPSGRPHLTLVSQAPAAPRQAARASAERLAEVTGGRIEQGEGGLQSVSFPAPGVPGVPAFSTAPVTVSRELSDGGGGAPATPSTPVEHPPSDDPKGVDVDALYDEFLERFKRDLLVEREQLGHLLIDNP
jgi:hypothetical protein